MDPRGIGKWDMMPLKQTEKAVWELDHGKADVAGLNGKPPPNDDGTANETLNDQVIHRLLLHTSSRYIIKSHQRFRMFTRRGSFGRAISIGLDILAYRHHQEIARRPT